MNETKILSKFSFCTYSFKVVSALIWLFRFASLFFWLEFKENGSMHLTLKGGGDKLGSVKWDSGKVKQST